MLAMGMGPQLTSKHIKSALSSITSIKCGLMNLTHIDMETLVGIHFGMVSIPIWDAHTGRYHESRKQVWS